jgi:hypothetical protein
MVQKSFLLSGRRKIVKRIIVISIILVQFAMVASITGCGGTNEDLPTYSQIVKTYPAGRAICKLKILMGPGDTEDTVNITYKAGTSIFEMDYIRCYGVKMTLMEPLSIDGRTYPKGAKFTVDKNHDWVQVRSWR